MNAAGLPDLKETFIWRDLSAPDFRSGVAPGFSQITGALREYGIAGVLHLDHIAALTGPQHAGAIDHHAFKIARALGVTEDVVRVRLLRVLNQHREEWHAFMEMVGSRSFLTGWAGGKR